MNEHVEPLSPIEETELITEVTEAPDPITVKATALEDEFRPVFLNILAHVCARIMFLREQINEGRLLGKTTDWQLLLNCNSTKDRKPVPCEGTPMIRLILGRAFGILADALKPLNEGIVHKKALEFALRSGLEKLAIADEGEAKFVDQVIETAGKKLKEFQQLESFGM
ncbi:MAG: hypothetical protein KKA90_03425 [Nanoarchaeota archaeon]|nr:hypothetical protein [Nanoarchaeota archaeon]